MSIAARILVPLRMIVMDMNRFVMVMRVSLSVFGCSSGLSGVDG